ncbi:MAG: hypothetical protein Greene041619_923 [Candidatus Peregrinibacteria bacterium Greene0416_19]|nr:MAG: hypothetical protein Greene041619_923 [Candidatus Peregrinibacteria bacterium Greene0416_19]
MHLTRTRILEGLLLAVCAAALLKAGYELGRVLLLEAQGAIESDAHLYFTVGRGMLNGLTPYVDLFESKPPGMFLLAMLSLLLTNGEWLALALQLLVFLAIPMLLGWYGWQQGKNLMMPFRMIATSVAALLGILLTLFLEERAGGVQTESFAVFALFVYLLFLLRFGEELPWNRIALLALPLLSAIGLKEPFLLSALAAAMLVISTPRQFLRGFVLPLLFAGAIGLVLLLLLGFVRPYLEIYVPSMLHGRVDHNPLEPLWIKSMMIGRVRGNITVYATAPILGYVLILLWLLLPAFKRMRTSLRDLGVTALTLFASYHVVLLGALFLMRRNAGLLNLQLQPGFVPVNGVVYVLLLLMLGGLFYLQWRRQLLPDTLTAIIALLLTSLAIGISIYAINHFAFGVPAYLALALIFIRYAVSFPRPTIVTTGIVVFILVTALFYRPSERHLQLLRERMGYTAAENRAYAHRVDALLDNCRIDRYASFGTFQRLAFARHSPLGPLFQPQFFEYLGLDHLLYKQTFDRLVNDAKIVIVYKGSWFKDISPDKLAPLFTADPPPCAKEFLPLAETTVLFRKKE